VIKIIKDIIYTAKSVSYFDLHLDLDSEDRLYGGNFTTKETIIIYKLFINSELSTYV